MSQSFIPEGNEQSLSDMPPTLNTEANYRTPENNGVRVYERTDCINE